MNNPIESYPCWGTTLDRNKMISLEQRYDLYVELYRLAETLRQIPDHIPPAEALASIANDLLAAIVADLGGSARMNEELAGLKKPLDFSAVQELIAREVGLGQPALGDLEGFYTGQVEGEERCLHLTFDDEATLLVDIFDSIAAAMPYGKGDLIVSPLYINLRTGEAWYDESEFPLPAHHPGLELAGELNQAITGLQHLLENLSVMAERVNLDQAIVLVKQRLDDDAATSPNTVDAWYLDVSQQLSRELHLPLDQAQQLVHLALGCLADIPTDTAGFADTFPVSAALVALARRHGGVDVSRNGGDT